MKLSERHQINLRAIREATGLSPEKFSELVWPGINGRVVGGCRIRAIERGSGFRREYADEIAAAVGLDVSCFSRHPDEPAARARVRAPATGPTLELRHYPTGWWVYWSDDDAEHVSEEMARAWMAAGLPLHETAKKVEKILGALAQP